MQYTDGLALKVICIVIVRQYKEEMYSGSGGRPRVVGSAARSWSAINPNREM